MIIPISRPVKRSFIRSMNHKLCRSFISTKVNVFYNSWYQQEVKTNRCFYSHLNSGKENTPRTRSRIQNYLTSACGPEKY